MRRKDIRIESGYYPEGAEFDPNAPYNIKSEMHEVTFSITASKTFKVKCNERISDSDVISMIPDACKLMDDLDSNNWSIDDYAIAYDD